MKCLVLTVLVVAAWVITLGIAWIAFRVWSLAAEGRDDTAIRVIGAVLLMAAVGAGVGALLSLFGSRKAGS